MTYFSLPLSFMHPTSIVMHPPKPMALSMMEYSYEDSGKYPQSIAPAYLVTSATGSLQMLEKVALYARPVETVIFMQSSFDAPGELRFSLTNAQGVVVLEKADLPGNGAGSYGIEMSWLAAGTYSLMVCWTEDEEESAVIYQIEKLL